MSHLQTTPTGRSKSSHQLLISPPGPGPRGLAFGSSKKMKTKANVGYGIVSASGFSAWKRSVKRGRTSTHNNTNTNTNKENTTLSTTTTTGTNSNAFNRELVKKKGLGMGLEGTPARKRYKRDSRISKASMGTQSTPKGSVSRVEPNGGSSSISNSMTLSPLTTGSPSHIQSASSVEINDHTFAVGAETIIGEDVFGLTISIDADGTTRPQSPDTSPTPTEKGYTTQWFDPEEEYNNYLQEKEEFDRLVEFAEMEVPVDFGDEDMEDERTIKAISQEQEQEVIDPESDEVDPTRIWDITVPIRETSVLSDEPNSDRRTMGQIDSLSGPSSGGSAASKQPDQAPTCRVQGKSKGSRSRSGISPETDVMRGGHHPDPVEIDRGLNISKIGLSSDKYLDSDFVDDVLHLDSEAFQAISPDRVDDQQPLRPEAHPELISPMEDQQNDQVDEVDFANRVTDPRWSLANERSPRFSLAAGETASVSSDNVEGDSLGFAKAERYMKRERPRWYRATSSPTPPPPGRELTRLTYSPTPVPSPCQSPSGLEAEVDVPARPDGPMIKGAWKGRDSHRLRKKTKRESGVSNDSRENEGQGRRQVEKVFIEPEYHGTAKRARDARIAHYKDLETNYKLVVEEVYF